MPRTLQVQNAFRSKTRGCQIVGGVSKPQSPSKIVLVIHFIDISAHIHIGRERISGYLRFEQRLVVYNAVRDIGSQTQILELIIDLGC